MRASIKVGSFNVINTSVLFENKLSEKLSSSFSAEWLNGSGKYKFRYQRVNPAGEIAYDTTAVRQNGDINATRLEGTLHGRINDGSWYIRATTIIRNGEYREQSSIMYGDAVNVFGTQTLSFKAVFKRKWLISRPTSKANTLSSEHTT